MNPAFTFDSSNFIIDLDVLPIGTYNLRLRALDNNSCGASIGILSADDFFTITLLYANSAPTWVTILVD